MTRDRPRGVEIGLWRGAFWGVKAVWLRSWDTASGKLLLTAGERIEAARRKAEAISERGHASLEQIEWMTAKLRELGIDPSSVT